MQVCSDFIKIKFVHEEGKSTLLTIESYRDKMIDDCGVVQGFQINS